MSKHSRKKNIPSIVLASFWFVASASADEAAIESEIKNLKEQVESQAEQINKLQSQSVSEQPTNILSDTTIGGYGEIAYNQYRQDSSRNQIDLKRFVILLGHRFNDRWNFNSEVEWEHAVTSQSDQGESEIEQAYLN